MRRLFAITILLAFLMGFVLPLVASPESQMPACCRRGGKHHCGMSMSHTAGTDEPQVTAVRPVCPYHCADLLANAHVPALSAPIAVRITFSTEFVRAEQIQPLLASADFNAHLQRGPPLDSQY